MIRFAIPVAFFVALLLATPVIADIQEGVNALGRGNYPKALQIFQPLAEGGDWNAQGFLAHTYKMMENHREACMFIYYIHTCKSSYSFS